MAISAQEIDIILSSVMVQYIFNTVFKDHNDGKEFDIQAWKDKLEEVTSDPMFNLSQEKQKQFADYCINLDQFAADASIIQNHIEDKPQEKPQLTLL